MNEFKISQYELIKSKIIAEGEHLIYEKIAEINNSAREELKKEDSFK